MPPQVEDIAVTEGPSEMKKNAGSEENGIGSRSALVVDQSSNNDFKLKTFMASLNLLGHLLAGAVTGISLIFAFRGGLPLRATPLHIVLCVLGYQLLMTEAILSLASSNGWSSHLRLVDKRRAHYVLQLVGSALAIAGSFVKIVDKSQNWNTLHGQFALVALICTTVSLVNGLSSLWAYELRRFLPGNLSKLSHILLGIVGFATACICLCYGFEKNMFKNWISAEIAYTMIAFTSALGFIVILTPIVTFYTKSKALVGR